MTLKPVASFSPSHSCRRLISHEALWVLLISNDVLGAPQLSSEGLLASQLSPGRAIPDGSSAGACNNGARVAPRRQERDQSCYLDLVVDTSGKSPAYIHHLKNYEARTGKAGRGLPYAEISFTAIGATEACAATYERSATHRRQSAVLQRRNVGRRSGCGAKLQHADFLKASLTTPNEHSCLVIRPS